MLYLSRYEGQRDMLYNQTFNLDQVAFASEGIKDAQQTVCATIIKHLLQTGSKKELKGMMKTVKIQDIDNLQDEMMDMMDISSEIQESLGRRLVCQMILMKMISWVTWVKKLKVKGYLHIFNLIMNAIWMQNLICL
ncbi:unnamed protein product [Lactuca saligna]|uniref:Uncharacterized protein n=1 Tax=Lactuca saligna TaxID=75948 RepID=A0AA35Z344_LACSI|nr:unnamed protein product [Lactuca saligna]